MKLQGVTILRISDFRRFFDLDEFLAKKKEFSELITLYGARYFCDKPKEIYLCGVIKNWINGSTVNAKISDGQFYINGDKEKYELGVLKQQIDKYKNQLSFKDLYGLTALCLLAGANETNCTFVPDYGLIMGGDNGEAFVSLHNDVEYPQAKEMHDGAFRLRVIANIHAGHPIKITVGTQQMILKEKQCVTSIFSNSGCVTLLDREASDLPRIYAYLEPNGEYRCANLKISGAETSIIPNIASVWLEPGAGIAYITTKGEIVFDKDKCFALKQRLNNFQRNAEGRKLLAIKKTDNGHYILYTDSQIDY